MIRGVYSHPKPFWERGARLDEYGINAVFAHSGNLDEASCERILAEGAQVYAEFATLNGKGYVEDHPETMPIGTDGEPVGPLTWFQGVNPLEPGFRQHRLDTLRELLRRLPLSGIWLDYLHWPAQFEVPDPTHATYTYPDGSTFEGSCLVQTSFDDRCVDAFQRDRNIDVKGASIPERAQDLLAHHYEAWTEWRCDVVTQWAAECRQVIREEKPDALMGNYLCPWTDDEWDGARREYLGLDPRALAEHTDVFSPMVYHGRGGGGIEGVRKRVEWLSEHLGVTRTSGDDKPRIWPIVQAHDDPDVIPPEEFEAALHAGLAGGATGVMMFTLGSVAQSDGKMAVLKRVYNQWRDHPPV